MVLSNSSETLLSDLKFSSVVPAKVTGDKDYELTNLDLALKLHYVKAVYFFNGEAVRGLTIYDLKKPMFQLLELFFTSSGRIRRSQTTGRPFVKCNDGGVRIVEAFCDKSMEEWMAMEDDSRHDCLAYNQVLGPDLGFSPLVFIQFTWFKSGGMSLGLSWAHIIGDPMSASAFVHTWGQIIAGKQVPPTSLHVQQPKNSETETQGPVPAGKLFPIKRVDPVGDLWQTPGNCNMKTHSFQFTPKQLQQIESTACQKAAKVSLFEVISAVIWKSLSKIREDSGPGVVTICRYNSGRRDNQMPANDMVLTTAEAGFNVSKCDVLELAELISDSRAADGNRAFDGMLESESSDFIMYGANLTFVNMEGADLYGLKLQGEKPVFVSYSINGVGEEGVVLDLRGPEGESDCECGRTVTVVLPENQLQKLKKQLNQEYGTLFELPF